VPGFQVIYHYLDLLLVGQVGGIDIIDQHYFFIINALYFRDSFMRNHSCIQWVAVRDGFQVGVYVF